MTSNQTEVTAAALCCAAYCRNSIDGQWYCFDDSEVSPVADEDVCQQTAYILFYQRRTAVPSWSANSSVAGPCFIYCSFLFCVLVLSRVFEPFVSAGSTSSSLCDHWINRLPGSRPASLASGASSRRTSLASLAESVEFPVERGEDDGETRLLLLYRDSPKEGLKLTRLKTLTAGLLSFSRS